MSQPTTSLGRALQGALDRGSDRALKFYDFAGPSASFSFGAFAQAVQNTSHCLANLGVRPGVVVALLGSTSVELCRTAAAVWTLGATLTVLPTPTRLGNLESYLMQTLGKLGQSQAGILIGEGSMVEAFSKMLPLACVTWDGLEGLSAPLSGPSADLEVVHSGVEAALVQFSSGTTRDPQPILLSQGALLANARAVLARFPGGADQHSCVSWLPLYHDMGLIGGFLMPLLAPCNLTLMGPEVFAARPVTWLEAISKERATTSSAPNFALAYCADRISDEGLAELDLSCWRIAMVGAEPVRPQTLRRFAEKFQPCGFSEQAFSPVYGLAEATLAVTFSPLGEGLKTLCLDREVLASSGRVLLRADSAERANGNGRCYTEAPSLGRPLDGVQVRIFSEGHPLPEDQLGEVLVKGPSLLSGYLCGESRDRLTEDGWLRTGDLGFLHEGELYLYGRRRDILLLDGRNHDPGLLEGAVEALEPLRRCCAFTQDAEGDRDLLVLVCEVSQAFAGEPQPLRREILAVARSGSGLTPTTVVLVKAGTLPSTSSGKLRRQETAHMYSSRGLELWEAEALRPS